mgnify:CR=1 FL=1
MKVGITFGGYCPMHQGHLDLIMQAKKENDICYVVVCGYDNEPRANETGLTLNRRFTLVKQMFKDDEQVRVLQVNDTKLGIDESMSDSNWDIWLDYIKNQMNIELGDIKWGNIYYEFTWYVGEPDYVSALNNRIDNDIIDAIIDKVIYVKRSNNPISATMIRENPIKYWNKIAWAFRPYFSTNILITGTASEGKSVNLKLNDKKSMVTNICQLLNKTINLNLALSHQKCEMLKDSIVRSMSSLFENKKSNLNTLVNKLEKSNTKC